MREQETSLRAVPRPNAGVSVSGLRIDLAGTSIPIVDEVSFQISAGEILGLVGESGSGKTTVGMALLGHSRSGLRISAGSVRLADKDVLRLTERELRAVRGSSIAYVPQDPGTALNPALRIGTQLRESLKGRAADEADVLQLLNDVKLPPVAAFLNAFPHQVSGGQQQRVAIAMAFASHPTAVVLDEPTTGLDVTTQSHVLDTIRRLCAKHGVAAVYVTHDLAVVASLADRVAVMYSGRIVEMGPTSVVLTEPTHPYTRALIRAVPDLEGPILLKGIPGQAPAPMDRPKGCAFVPRCSMSIAACAEAPPPISRLSENHEVRCIRSDVPIKAAAQTGRDAMAVERIGPPLLEIKALRAFHGNAEIIKGIDLALPHGCSMALVGESGSGKTTLARSIAGLHKKIDGLMYYDGRLLAAGSRNRTVEVRRQIQYICQNPYASLNPRRSIGEAIAFPLRAFEDVSHQEVRRRVDEALDQVALPRRAALQYPHHLSGGQRQRAAIARALIVNPTLLVCDEVTSALDVSIQAVIVELLDRLQRERGISMLFVTHNLPLIRSVAQQVAVMQSGRIVELGAVKDVLQRPQAAETTRLVKDAPHFRQV
jgi:peptide/nickel transport system ATP-binding protein